VNSDAFISLSAALTWVHSSPGRFVLFSINGNLITLNIRCGELVPLNLNAGN
jgi:hypothetical protein